MRGEIHEGETQGDLERRRRGQARALLQVAADLQACAHQRKAGSRSSAAAPRTNARQPSARGDIGELELVLLAEVARVGVDALRAGESGSAACARTVTPSAIANGSARPWL